MIQVLKKKIILHRQILKHISMWVYHNSNFQAILS